MSDMCFFGLMLTIVAFAIWHFLEPARSVASPLPYSTSITSQVEVSTDA